MPVIVNDKRFTLEIHTYPKCRRGPCRGDLVPVILGIEAISEVIWKCGRCGSETKRNEGEDKSIRDRISGAV